MSDILKTSDGSPLESDERGVRYFLDGRQLNAGDVLEVLTDTGWISGHYTEELHPETGALAFEMHVRQEGGHHEHVVVFLSPESLFRRPRG